MKENQGLAYFCNRYQTKEDFEDACNTAHANGYRVHSYRFVEVIHELGNPPHTPRIYKTVREVLFERIDVAIGKELP